MNGEMVLFVACSKSVAAGFVRVEGAAGNCTAIFINNRLSGRWRVFAESRMRELIKSDCYLDAAVVIESLGNLKMARKQAR